MSTPIETNTEELQEILQTVYNLPNAGGSGGSVKPDLVLSLDLPRSYSFTKGNENAIRDSISIKSGSIENTLAKLENREEVKVFMEYEYYYGGSTRFVGTYYPTTVCRNSSGNDANLALEFLCNGYPGSYDYLNATMVMLLDTDGSFLVFKLGGITVTV